MNRISHENPGEGKKINHRMQLMKFRTISAKAEKITVCQARGTAPLHAGAGAVAPPCALGWAGDGQWCPEWCPPACPGLVLCSDSSYPFSYMTENKLCNASHRRKVTNTSFLLFVN